MKYRLFTFGSVVVSAMFAVVLSCTGNMGEETTATTGAASSTLTQFPACTASLNWVNSPSPPHEIASTETFCDFYQFAEQWFLSLVSPSSATPGSRESALRR